MKVQSTSAPSRMRSWFATAMCAFSTVSCTAESPGFAFCFVSVAPTFVVDAFMTPDQKGRAWFEGDEPMRAAHLFRDPLWKGVALAAAGDFASASMTYQGLESPEGAFRLGNMLARMGQLRPAVEAYRRALALRPKFAEASFNLEWVSGLLELEGKVYEDFGGTGGKLEADEIVFDDRAAEAIGEMTLDEALAQGLSEKQMRELWMRRVKTSPGEFLRLKFSYQAQGAGQ